MIWILYASLSAIFAALVALFAKLEVSHIDATVATTIRSVVMLSFLLVVSIVLKKWDHFHPASMHMRDWAIIIASGVASATSWLFYFLAFKTGPVTQVVAIDRSSFALVFILSVLFFGQPVTIKAVSGVIAMMGGVYLLLS